jgi:hypothetical protein
MTAESKIRLAARLYEARDTAKRLLDDKYASRMQEGGTLLTDVAEKTGKHLLVIATEMAKQMEQEGRPYGALAILAAAVELLEPSV